MPRLLVLIAVFAVTVSGSALAEEQLDTREIQAAVVGKTLTGLYPGQQRWTETYLVDGELVYSEDGVEVRGEWRAIDDRFCTLYKGSVEGGCFLVVRRSRNCLDFYAAEPGDGSPLASASDIAAGRDWTARGWRADQPGTCEVGDVI